VYFLKETREFKPVTFLSGINGENKMWNQLVIVFLKKISSFQHEIGQRFERFYESTFIEIPHICVLRKRGTKKCESIALSV